MEEKEKNEKPINDGAKYICFPMGNKKYPKAKMWVDMREIKDIKMMQVAYTQDDHQKLNICAVIYQNDEVWQNVVLDDETLEIFNNFKQNKEEK